MSSSEPVEHRSHRWLGEHLDLFHIPAHSPGMASWHPDGLIVYRQMEELIRELGGRYGYEEVRSPLVCDNALWERSGHAQKFASKMFSLDVDGHFAALKPMNCPGHCDLYAHQPRSYRQLPLRLSELGHVHRAEQSGEVNGLLRARSFVIDDAHLFCAEEQVAQELAGCVAMAMEIYDLFGLEPHAELSLRPEVRLGSDELWDRSEQALRDALHDANLDYEEQPGEGAFYGPKIDLHVSDRLGRSWQLGSVQLDYQLPQRFDLSYIDEQGERQRPVIIHRALLGSLERFIAILLEHYDGALPAWLAPRAAHILPISDQQLAHAQQLADRLRLAGVRCAVRADGPLNGRIRDAHDRRVGVIAIIGAREVADGRVAVRSDGGQSVIAIDAFVADVSERVANRQS